MEEKKKHKVMIGIEVVLLCMLVAILGTNAASSDPPSNGVSYGGNNQTTVEGALNDLYNKANYGNASEGQILKGKTALVGGKKVTGTMEDRGLVQYGSWGCGDAGCGSGNDAYYSINALPEGYYHSDGEWWAPEARINANTLRSSLGITANKIVKGQSIAGVVGTGETSCPSCPECKECPTCPTCTGDYKFWKFDKDATYTRTSTGTDTTLSYGSYHRLCADNKECTYWFTIPLDSGIKVNKIYSCTANLSTKNNGPMNGTLSVSTTKGEAKHSYNGFRMNRGYSSASSSGTQQYWYMNSLQASQVWGDIESYKVTATGSGWYPVWGTWSDSGMNMKTAQSTAQGFSTNCGVNGSNFVMSLTIFDSALTTYDSSFMLSGSIVYQ